MTLNNANEKATTTTPASSQPSPSLQIQTTTTIKKLTVQFKAVGNAPILKQKFFEVEATRSIASIQQFLRRILHIGAGDSLFVYVNSSFSPTPEHTLEQLHRCFGSAPDSKLTLQYSTIQAWG